MLYWTFRGYGHSDSQWWAAITSAASAGWPRNAAEVDSWITSTLGLSSFYSSWVEAGHSALPLLALTGWGPADGVEDGGTAITRTDVVVAQVQQTSLTTVNGCIANAKIVADVPFLLGCGTLSDPSVRPFVECAASISTVGDDQPFLLSDEAESISISKSAEIGAAAPYPAYVAILSNDALLPENVPSAGAASFGPNGRAWRWFLACEDGSTACGADVDDDDWASGFDCDDALDTIRPDATPGAPGLYDNNCDGWR